MFESLIQYIQKNTASNLSDESIEIIRQVFVQKKLKKKQYLLQEGEVCKYFAFIVKGAFLQYITNDTGKDHIVHLSIENWWVGDRDSWVNATPSLYNIQAWENAELLLISRADTLYLASVCPAFNEMLRGLDDRNYIATQKRIASSISATAEKRYEDFLINHRDFFLRFPQHIIASYLGITKDTLSRVRKNLTGI